MASKWNEEQMAAALDEVRTGHISQYLASKKYDIPRQTLSDRFLGKCSNQSGRPPRLSKEEENEIVECCLAFSEWGFGMGKHEIMGIVTDYLKSKRKTHLFPPNGIPGQC